MAIAFEFWFWIWMHVWGEYLAERAICSQVITSWQRQTGYGINNTMKLPKAPLWNKASHQNSPKMNNPRIHEKSTSVFYSGYQVLFLACSRGMHGYLNTRLTVQETSIRIVKPVFGYSLRPTSTCLTGQWGKYEKEMPHLAIKDREISMLISKCVSGLKKQNGDQYNSIIKKIKLN